MGNLIDYLKDKIYYIMGATVVVIVLLIVIGSCSNMGGSYSSIENKMVSAAKNYYAAHEKNLPKEDGNSIRVTINTLIEAELLKEIKDPNNKKQLCSGYVEVTKVGEEFVYTPFLVCEGNYEPKYLTDIIKNETKDEYGNGVYEMNGEYIYRGDEVNNYVTFNNQTWRILKLDKDGDIKLVYAAEKNDNKFSWDTKYNSEKKYEYGVTTDYLQTDIRKALVNFYETNFTDQSKSLIVAKNICVGPKEYDENASIEKECSVVKENEYIGLMQITDYYNVSLDSGCTHSSKNECSNRNYLSKSGISSWLLTRVEDTSYEVYSLDSRISYSKANRLKKISPVIYLSHNTIVSSGNGGVDKKYIIKQ